jgi:thiol:disulfide interchange protein DsbC
MMRHVQGIAAAIAGLALVAVAAQAAEKGGVDVRQKIASQLNVKVEDVQPSPVPGLYEVNSGTDIGYVSEDGRFYVDGDVYDMATHEDLTEQTRRQVRLALLKSVRDEDTVVFAPKDVKYTINVFTDMDCTYCRKLHSEIGQLNAMGVKVRYLMFPRNGPDTPSWKKAEAVWCSKDRNDALTRAKRGEQIVAQACDDPVASQFELGHKLGVRGTPGIVTEQGDLIGGYVPAASLVKHLEMLAGKTG